MNLEKRKRFDTSIYVLLGVLTAIFIVDVATNFQLREYLALYPGEYTRFWTIFTVNIVHGGPLHLLMNGFFLFIISRMYRSIPGNATTFWFVLITSGVFSGIVTMFIAPPDIPHVGISGAIFGLLSYGFLAFKDLPGSTAKKYHKDLGFIILFNIIITMILPFVSATGHFGGLAAGALIYFTLRLSSK